MDIEKKEEKIEAPITSKRKKIVIGKVNCDQLFLRAEPDKESDALYVMSKDEAVAIDMDRSTSDFYAVTVNGASGFCVKTFITIQ